MLMHHQVSAPASLLSYICMTCVVELYHPVWPEFDPRKDVADGRKEGFNMLVEGQLDFLAGVVCPPFMLLSDPDTHSL